MKAQDEATQAVKGSLETLNDRIKFLVPTVICVIEDRRVNDSYQVCASFMRTTQSDTLDLCIVLRWTGTDVVASADLVRGGSGEVVSEMPPVKLPGQRGGELNRLINNIREYILSQEDKIVQNLI
jgi:hypothetical protein